MDQDNNLSNIIDLTQFKNQQDLLDFAKKQFLTILHAHKRIEALELENEQLKGELELVKTNVEVLAKTNEQNICELEIKRLRDIAINTALSFEDTKRLEILIKSLYLIKGKPKSDLNGESKKIDDFSESELIRLATQNK